MSNDRAEHIIPHDIADTERQRRLIRYVYAKHEGQIDKQGKPYHEHLLQVAMMVESHLRLSAYAHDVVEDTDATFGDLFEVGFTYGEIDVIDSLTRAPAEPHHDYLQRLIKSRGAVKIKIADVLSNVSRLSTLEDRETAKRLEKKYYYTLSFLAGVTW